MYLYILLIKSIVKLKYDTVKELDISTQIIYIEEHFNYIQYDSINLN